MSAGFDRYRASYGDEVQGSIDFSGLKHDFFLSAKADVLERIIDERGLRAGGRNVEALDVGCGVGALHPHLAGVFDRLDGCDISGESVARARLDNPGNTYAAYDPPRLPYPDASFDLAMASCVMHHVPPAEWPVFAAEMRRVLRPGGVVVIIEHNPWNPLTRLAVFRCPFDEDAVLLKAGRTARILEGAGFSETRNEHFLLLPSENRAARAIERVFAGIPLGAQYACSARA